MARYLGFLPKQKLYKIFTKFQHFPPLHQSYSRKEQVIINRLIIGHTHLTHSYLLNKEQPPNCNYCKSLLTVEHILTSCSAYKILEKRKHCSNSQHSHILTNISKQHIFNYLTSLTKFNFLCGTIWPICTESAVKPQLTNLCYSLTAIMLPLRQPRPDKTDFCVVVAVSQPQLLG